MKIFVGNLAHEVDEQELIALFAEHGSVSSVKIVRDGSNQMSRGFGFVEMVRKVDAKKALKTLNDFELKGKRLSVNVTGIVPVEVKNSSEEDNEDFQMSL